MDLVFKKIGQENMRILYLEMHSKMFVPFYLTRGYRAKIFVNVCMNAYHNWSPLFLNVFKFILWIIFLCFNKKSKVLLRISICLSLSMCYYEWHVKYNLKRKKITSAFLMQYIFLNNNYLNKYSQHLIRELKCLKI